MNTLIIITTPIILNGETHKQCHSMQSYYFNNVHAAANFLGCTVKDLVLADVNSTKINESTVTILEDEHVMFSLDPDLV